MSDAAGLAECENSVSLFSWKGFIFFDADQVNEPSGVLILHD